MAKKTKKTVESPNTFQVEYGKIAVKMEAAPDMSPGGIALPPSVAQRKTGVGTVVSVPSDTDIFDDLTIASGMTVYFPVYAGHEIEVNGEKLIVLKDEDILGYLKS